jgi:hypothetical protein
MGRRVGCCPAAAFAHSPKPFLDCFIFRIGKKGFRRFENKFETTFLKTWNKNRFYSK